MRNKKGKVLGLIVGVVCFLVIIGASLFILPRHSSGKPPIMKDVKDYKEKYIHCESASIIFTLGTVHLYQEILGPEDGLCRIKSRYEKHPDPNFEGKEMVCKEDVSLGYAHSYELTDDICEGELWDLQKYNPKEDVCKNIRCENCVSGHLEYYLGECVECISWNDCKEEGSDCVSGKCVEVECIGSSDCGVGEICLHNVCRTEEGIYNEFQKCDFHEDDPYSVCNQVCDNCKTGTYTCIIGAWKNRTGVSFCVECLNDGLCKEGYTCKGYKCVENNI